MPEYRSSLAGFFAASALAIELAIFADNYFQERFCREYGWLKSRPAAEQMAYARKITGESLFAKARERAFMDLLQNCE